MKKGFTIIELLMVVAILAVLLGIVTTAATASIRQARERRTQAMKQTLQNGIAAYRMNGFEVLQRLQHFHAADVSRVPNLVHILEVLQYPRVQQTVCVRE